MESNSELGFKEEDYYREDEFEQMLENVPKERELFTGMTFHSYQGFWVPYFIVKPVLLFQKHFVALDSDLFLASCPKSGTTWLKALSYSIVNRHHFPLSNSPLHTSNPHDLVLNLEFDVYHKPESINSLETIRKPRLLCTHLPYSSLPLSIKTSKCKIVYICRNTMDQFVASWHFFPKVFGENERPIPTEEEYLDQFCRGVHLFGPSWDHVLGFWKASLESPHKILFMKYEDLKNDAMYQVKRLAEFLGFPFSEEEEKQGLVEEIIRFCSIDNMKSLKGNIDGKRRTGTPNSSYFRKGEVGDWMNHLTPSMAERMKKLIQEKFQESSLKMF